MPKLSSRAIIDPKAELADDVRVGPFAYVGPNVRAEAGCTIGNNATVTGRTTLGANTRVFPLALVGAPADADRAPRPVEDGECIIGRDNVIREHVTIRAGATGGPATRIGDDNLIMIACQIGPGAVVGDHGIFANCSLIEGGAVVEDYVRTSAFSSIAAGVRVGAYTFVGGYAVVDSDAPPYAMLQGCPYRVRGANTQNLGRCGFAGEDVAALKDAFRELFAAAGPRPDPEALRRLAADQHNPHVRRLVLALQAARGAERNGHD